MNSRPDYSRLAADREIARLAAVHRYQLLDTPPDGTFDLIAQLAASVFSVPIAIISLVDHDRIWFKSHHGLSTQQIGRDDGLCASAVLHDGPWLLTDAKSDPRSLSNPLVAGEFGLRFYLGIPLRTSDGYNLGTLCVIDYEPRVVEDAQIVELTRLAALVMEQMELRLSARTMYRDFAEVVSRKDAELARAVERAKEIESRTISSLTQVSLLSLMDSQPHDDDASAEELARASGRFTAIAQVHQHIYAEDEFERTNIRSYLQHLCSALLVNLATPPTRIIVDGVDAEIEAERMIPLGLIVNELVTSAIQDDSSRIVLYLSSVEPRSYSLAISDDGKGLGETFDPDGSSGRGWAIVKLLARQIDGSVYFGRLAGGRATKIDIVFPQVRQLH